MYTLVTLAQMDIATTIGLLNSRSYVLSQCLIKGESANLQIISGSLPGASCPLINSLLIEGKALLPGD